MDDAPPAMQSFDDEDLYKAAKKRMREYAAGMANKSPDVRYYRLVVPYKHKVTVWIINGGPGIPVNHVYGIGQLGPISKLKIKATAFIRHMMIDGAVFHKRTLLNFVCQNLELRNCIWSTAEARLAVESGCIVSIHNPGGEFNPAIETVCSATSMISKLLGKS